MPARLLALSYDRGLEEAIGIDGEPIDRPLGFPL